MKGIFLFILLFSSTLLFAQESCFSVRREAKIMADTKIDYDFTKLNYNMASGILYDMLREPKRFEGKSVKIEGQFYDTVFESKKMFAVIIWDLTGCCPTGLTIVPLSSKIYPDYFPEPGTYITVTGTLEMLNFVGQDSLYLVAEIWE